MKNKFVVFFIFVLFPLLLFHSSCKKSEGEGVYLVTSAEASVYYDGIAFTTDLFFRCTVLNQSEIPGTITGWKIVYKFKSTEILEITSENCTSYNMAKHVDLQIHPYKERIIIGKSVPAVEKTVFSSLNIPDNMDISVAITDDHSNQSTIHFNTPIQYTEYND